MLEIRPDLVIPENELELVTSRSSGPGGQHVNKTETRVTVRFDIAASDSLEEAQKQRIRRRLASRINKRGVLRVSSQRHRSQADNRSEALDLMAELIRRALERRKRRKRTRPSRAARRRRLKNKRHRGRIKKLRREPRRDD